MSSRFSFSNLPWVHNIQNAVDSAVHDIARAAGGVAESFRGPGHSPQNQQQQQQQQPPFPFFFPQATTQPPPAAAASTQRTPAASARAIRQLPTILVAPEDLVDENNRECCICMEPNCLGEKVTRLPCAHIFHSTCIVDWLRNHHCTCPICRYELPTDDPMYEAGRAERMQARKPRFARYELERMSIKELVNLNRGRALGIGEKKDLIQFLIDNERIDLIPAPEPVEYRMKDLKAMRISELKRAMASAGVFFHAKDVIEKSDMITIFLNSGRLNVLPVDDEIEQAAVNQDFIVPPMNKDDESSRTSQKVRLPSKRPLVETVDEDECSETADREKRPANYDDHPTPVVMFPEVTSPVASRTGLQTGGCGDETPRTSRSTSLSGLSDEPEAASSSQQEGTSDPTQPNLDSGESYPSGPQVLEQSRQMSAENAVSSPGGTSCSDMSIDELEPARDTLIPTSADPPLAEPQLSTETQGSAAVLAPEESAHVPNEPQLADCPLGEYSVAQLLSLGREANIDLSSCFERSEMVNILVAAGVTGRAHVDLRRSRFANWSVSQLRAVASEVNIDLSGCSDQTEIVDRILEEANSERPHLRNYLRVLSPLTTSSLSQLRATARDWDVDISDCLEMEEIIQRLISRANQFGIC